MGTFIFFGTLLAFAAVGIFLAFDGREGPAHHVDIEDLD